MLPYYGKLCTEVYDFDKPIGSSFGDVEFYKDRLQSITGKILEHAVGTGRLLIPLLEEGFNIEGFDLSLDMLSVCKEHCLHRNLFPKLYQDNMVSFSLDEKFEAIIIPTGTFLLIANREESLKALQNFYNHLNRWGNLFSIYFFQLILNLTQVL